MNQIDLRGRRAVITGGAQGIGLAVARRFAASGASVVIWDINGDAARAAADELGGVARQVELTDDADVAHPQRVTVTVQGEPVMRGCGDLAVY